MVALQEGLRPLHHACIAGSVSVVEVLILEGARLAAPDRHGMTALHHACQVHRRVRETLLLQTCICWPCCCRLERQRSLTC